MYLDEDEVISFLKKAEDLRQYVGSKALSAKAVCNGTFDSIPYITVRRRVQQDNITELQDPVPITFPVTESLCDTLIEQGYCQQSPFGRGVETLMDTNIRRAWQIDPECITIHSSEIEELLCSDSNNSKLLKSIQNELAGTHPIRAEFYKMLVYRKGDFFVTHKDTQRSETHFASLIVFLPSVYTGGELLVRHLDREHSFFSSLSLTKEQGKPLHCTWVAFFTDCNHEVLPMIDGCRIALAFNIHRKHRESPIPAIPTETADDKLGQHLYETFYAMKSNLIDHKKLGYVLQHHYTKCGLHFDNLKGNDLELYKLLRMLRNKYTVKIKLIHTTVEEVYGGSKQWTKDSGDLFINALSDRSMTIKISDNGSNYETWKVDGEIARSGSVYFLLTPESIPEDMVDESEGEGYVLGNEGTYYFDLKYSKAALIISQKEFVQFYSTVPGGFSDITIVCNSSDETDLLDAVTPRRASLEKLGKRKRESEVDNDNNTKKPRFKQID
jgi:hypothetical protein